MTRNDDNLNHLLSLLQTLQIKENHIIHRIIACHRNRIDKENQQNRNNNDSSSEDNRNNNDSSSKDNSNNEQPNLAIGDRVEILNPRRLQANSGIITRITKSRVTITPTRGSKIVRHPRNVRKID